MEASAFWDFLNLKMKLKGQVSEISRDPTKNKEDTWQQPEKHNMQHRRGQEEVMMEVLEVFLK